MASKPLQLCWAGSPCQLSCICIPVFQCAIVDICAPAQDFLNGVCTHTIWLTDKVLTYYTGDPHPFLL